MFRTTPSTTPILVAAFNGSVFGLHARTGRRIWRYAGMGHTIRLAVHQERIIALGDHLACLDEATGTLLWRNEVPHTLIWGTLLVHGDLIVAADAGEVGVYDAGDGKQLWHERFKGEGVSVVAVAFGGKAVQGDRAS